MEKIVAVGNLAAVLGQLHSEGYDPIVVVPLTVMKLDNDYTKRKVSLGDNVIHVPNNQLLVSEYHVVAFKKPSLRKLPKILRWLSTFN